MSSRFIDVLPLIDFIDSKVLELRKNEGLPFMAKITGYNLLIDLQEFIKSEQEKETLTKGECD